ncbi:hypothetical protein ACU4GR_08230 (plasmid) [Methylobacterium oryzae CBMB20]
MIGTPPSPGMRDLDAAPQMLTDRDGSAEIVSGTLGQGSQEAWSTGDATGDPRLPGRAQAALAACGAIAVAL